MSRIDDSDYNVEPFKNRLSDYSKTICKSFRDFEDKCGLSHAGLSGIGKQGPTTSYLAKIADACPELNMNWLIRGDGEMLLPKKNESPAAILPSVQIHSAQTVNIGNWGDLVELIKGLQK